MKDLSLLHIVLIYLAVINVVTCFMYGVPAIIIVQLALIGYFLYR